MSHLDTLTGIQLDNIGRFYEILRRPMEPDTGYRQRLFRGTAGRIPPPGRASSAGGVPLNDFVELLLAKNGTLSEARSEALEAAKRTLEANGYSVVAPNAPGPSTPRPATMNDVVYPQNYVRAIAREAVKIDPAVAMGDVKACIDVARRTIAAAIAHQIIKNTEIKCETGPDGGTIQLSLEIHYAYEDPIPF